MKAGGARDVQSVATGVLRCATAFDCVRARRAGNGTRTRDPNLGKVVLYQLSYSRADPASAAACAPRRPPVTCGGASQVLPRVDAHCVRYRARDGGEGNRTPDLLNAIQALSQLSYAPGRSPESWSTRRTWRRVLQQPQEPRSLARGIQCVKRSTLAEYARVSILQRPTGDARRCMWSGDRARISRGRGDVPGLVARSRAQHAVRARYTCTLAYTSVLGWPHGMTGTAPREAPHDAPLGAPHDAPRESRSGAPRDASRGALRGTSGDASRGASPGASRHTLERDALVKERVARDMKRCADRRVRHRGESPAMRHATICNADCGTRVTQRGAARSLRFASARAAPAAASPAARPPGVAPPGAAPPVPAR